MDSRKSAGHDAFYLVDAIPALEERVTALTYSGDFVYVGTASGKLLQFLVTPKSGSGRTEYTSVKEKAVDAAAGRNAVTQLEAIPDLQLLIALCDGAVSLHRLQTLDKLPSVLDSKSAVSFAVNTKARKLCVVSSKRRLRLYEWLDGKFAPTRAHPELDMPDVPRAVAYHGARICVGYQREYNVLMEETGDVRDVSGSMNRDTRPLVKGLPGDTIMVVCAGEVGVVLTATGDPATGSPIVHFGHRPISLGYCYPYILSIGEASPKVEVHATRGGRDDTVQCVTLPGPALALADGRAGNAARYDESGSEGGKGRNPVFVAFAVGAGSRVCRLQPAPVDRQVGDLLAAYQVIAAGELLTNMIPEPAALAQRLARLNVDAGRSLFLGLHFEQAWPFLIASGMDPREVLQMFPDLLPGSTAPLGLVGGHAHAGSSAGMGGGTALTGGLYTPLSSRYFSVSLTQAVASGLKAPQEAASEAADSRGGFGDVDDGGMDSLLTQGGKGAPSAVTGRVAVADISSLICAQQGAYKARMRGSVEEDPTVGDTHVGVRPKELAATGGLEVEGRLKAAYHGLLAFCRHRRAAVCRALRALGDGEEVHAGDGAMEGNDEGEYGEGGDGGWEEGRAGAAASRQRASVRTAAESSAVQSSTVDEQMAAAGLRLPSHFVSVQRGARSRGFSASGSAFTTTSYGPAELTTLASVLDTALLKCFVALGMHAHVDRLVALPNRLHPADVSSLLRTADLSGAPRLHTLALFYAGRGMAREALSVWRDLGLGNVPAERAVSTAAKKDGEEEEEEEDAASRPRCDSLDDFDELEALGEALVSEGALSGVDEEVPAQHKRRLGAGAGTSRDLTLLALALARCRKVPGSSFDGVPESVAFLRRLGEPSAALVNEFAEWLLLRVPVRALAIFTAPTRSTPLSDAAVLEYLSGPRFSEAARRNPGGGVARMFLEALVGDPSIRPVVGEERHATRLAREYIAAVTALRSAGGVVGASAPTSAAAIAARMALEGPAADRVAPGSEGGVLGQLRGRLMRLLQQSPMYDAPALAALLKDTSLLEERVVLAGRTEAHEEALGLLVGSLGDHPGAVRYCEAVAGVAGDALQGALSSAREQKVGGRAGAAVASEGTGPFLVLLRRYLDAHASGRPSAAPAADTTQTGAIPPGASAYLASAMELLDTHATHVDPVEACKSLPGDLQLRSVLRYARTVLPSSTHSLREAITARHLCNYSYIASHALLVERQRAHVTLTRTTICPVCDKRVGDAVFALLPDGRPVHFYCQTAKDAGIATTGRRNAGMLSSERQEGEFALYDVAGTRTGPLALHGLSAPARKGLEQREQRDVSGGPGEGSHGGETSPSDGSVDAKWFVTAGVLKR